MFIVYVLDTWSRDLSSEFTLGDYLFGTVKLTKTSDSDKYRYSGYGIGFDSSSHFSLYCELVKNVIIFGEDNSLSLDTNNGKSKFFGEGPTNVLDDTAITTKAEYTIYIMKSRKKNYLSLSYNGANNFMYANSVRLQQFTAKDSEIKP